jgi:hypothetical protein
VRGEEGREGREGGREARKEGTNLHIHTQTAPAATVHAAGPPRHYPAHQGKPLPPSLPSLPPPLRFSPPFPPSFPPSLPPSLPRSWSWPTWSRRTSCAMIRYVCLRREGGKEGGRKGGV